MYFYIIIGYMWERCLSGKERDDDSGSTGHTKKKTILRTYVSVDC